MYCENSSTRSRVVTADRDRGAQALIGVTGRHPDVHHGDVRMVLAHGGEQVLGVTHGRDHLVAAVGQDLGQARPDYR